MRHARTAPSPRTLLAAAAVPAAVLGLLVAAGCAAADQDEGVGPLLADESETLSEEEALAVAHDIYSGYIDVIGQIHSDDDRDTEPLRRLVTESYFEIEAAALDDLDTQGVTVIGSREIQIESVSLQAPGQADYSGGFTAYICTDIGAVDAVDSDGSSIVRDDRDDTSALEVQFVPSIASDLGFMINDRLSWQPDLICESK